MTNESISGFLNSIAEAKRAFDAEPDYQRRIQSLSDDINRLQSTVASRELRIHDLKQNEETLTAKLRSVEAERDDAGFRALEEADKVQNLLSSLHGFINDGLKVLSTVEGYEQIVVNKADRQRELDYANARQERVVELEGELQSLHNGMQKAQEQFNRPFASATPSSQGEGTDPYFKPYEYPSDMPGQSEADPSPASVSDPIPPASGNESATDPTVTTTQTVPSTSAPSAVSQDTAPTMTSASVEGQSEGPFASRTSTQSETASSTSVPAGEGVSTSASPPERNRDRSTFFKGRKYFDVTYFVPLHQWLNDGGTREDYYWRPAEANVPLPEASQASHRS